jgi:hypothetical protein
MHWPRGRNNRGVDILGADSFAQRMQGRERHALGAEHFATMKDIGYASAHKKLLTRS